MDSEYELQDAIVGGDLEKVKTLIAQEPSLLRWVLQWQTTRSSLIRLVGIDWDQM